MNLYTTEEIAKILKIDIETVRRFIREKKIIASKVGSEWRINEEDLRDYLDKNLNIEN